MQHSYLVDPIEQISHGLSLLPDRNFPHGPLSSGTKGFGSGGHMVIPHVFRLQLVLGGSCSKLCSSLSGARLTLLTGPLSAPLQAGVDVAAHHLCTVPMHTVRMTFHCFYVRYCGPGIAQWCGVHVNLARACFATVNAYIQVGSCPSAVTVRV